MYRGVTEEPKAGEANLNDAGPAASPLPRFLAVGSE